MTAWSAGLLCTLTPPPRQQCSARLRVRLHLGMWQLSSPLGSLRGGPCVIACVDRLASLQPRWTAC